MFPTGQYRALTRADFTMMAQQLYYGLRAILQADDSRQLLDTNFEKSFGRGPWQHGKAPGSNGSRSSSWFT
jgi:hypothetical protein